MDLNSNNKDINSIDKDKLSNENGIISVDLDPLYIEILSSFDFNQLLVDIFDILTTSLASQTIVLPHSLYYQTNISLYKGKVLSIPELVIFNYEEPLLKEENISLLLLMLKEVDKNDVIEGPLIKILNKTLKLLIKTPENSTIKPVLTYILEKALKLTLNPFENSLKKTFYLILKFISSLSKDPSFSNKPLTILLNLLTPSFPLLPPKDLSLLLSFLKTSFQSIFDPQKIFSLIESLHKAFPNYETEVLSLLSDNYNKLGPIFINKIPELPLKFLFFLENLPFEPEMTDWVQIEGILASFDIIGLLQKNSFVKGILTLTNLRVFKGILKEFFLEIQRNLLQKNVFIGEVFFEEFGKAFPKNLMTFQYVYETFNELLHRLQTEKPLLMFLRKTLMNKGFLNPLFLMKGLEEKLFFEVFERILPEKGVDWIESSIIDFIKAFNNEKREISLNIMYKLMGMAFGKKEGIKEEFFREVLLWPIFLELILEKLHEKYTNDKENEDSSEFISEYRSFAKEILIKQRFLTLLSEEILSFDLNAFILSKEIGFITLLIKWLSKEQSPSIIKPLLSSIITIFISFPSIPALEALFQTPITINTLEVLKAAVILNPILFEKSPINPFYLNPVEKAFIKNENPFVKSFIFISEFSSLHLEIPLIRPNRLILSLFIERIPLEGRNRLLGYKNLCELFISRKEQSLVLEYKGIEEFTIIKSIIELKKWFEIEFIRDKGTLEVIIQREKIVQIPFKTMKSLLIIGKEGDYIGFKGGIKGLELILKGEKADLRSLELISKDLPQAIEGLWAQKRIFNIKESITKRKSSILSLFKKKRSLEIREIHFKIKGVFLLEKKEFINCFLGIKAFEKLLITIENLIISRVSKELLLKILEFIEILLNEPEIFSSLLENSISILIIPLKLLLIYYPTEKPFFLYYFSIYNVIKGKLHNDSLIFEAFNGFFLDFSIIKSSSLENQSLFLKKLQNEVESQEFLLISEGFLLLKLILEFENNYSHNKPEELLEKEGFKLEKEGFKELFFDVLTSYLRKSSKKNEFSILEDFMLVSTLFRRDYLALRRSFRVIYNPLLEDYLFLLSIKDFEGFFPAFMEEILINRKAFLLNEGEVDKLSELVKRDRKRLVLLKESSKGQCSLKGILKGLDYIEEVLVMGYDIEDWIMMLLIERIHEGLPLKPLKGENSIIYNENEGILTIVQKFIRILTRFPEMKKFFYLKENKGFLNVLLKRDPEGEEGIKLLGLIFDINKGFLEFEYFVSQGEGFLKAFLIAITNGLYVRREGIEDILIFLLRQLRKLGVFPKEVFLLLWQILSYTNIMDLNTKNKVSIKININENDINEINTKEKEQNNKKKSVSFAFKKENTIFLSLFLDILMEGLLIKDIIVEFLLEGLSILNTILKQGFLKGELIEKSLFLIILLIKHPKNQPLYKENSELWKLLWGIFSNLLRLFNEEELERIFFIKEKKAIREIFELGLIKESSFCIYKEKKDFLIVKDSLRDNDKSYSSFYEDKEMEILIESCFSLFYDQFYHEYQKAKTKDLSVILGGHNLIKPHSVELRHNSLAHYKVLKSRDSFFASCEAIFLDKKTLFFQKLEG